jgi:hypothetical protein
MRYESSQLNEKSWIDNVLPIVNRLLILIILFCLDYMFIKFLFY